MRECGRGSEGGFFSVVELESPLLVAAGVVLLSEQYRQVSRMDGWIDAFRIDHEWNFSVSRVL